MMWRAEELKVPYIPALIEEWEITTVDTMKMLVSFVVEVSYEFASLCSASIYDYAVSTA